MTRTKFCELWAARLLYEKNTSMGSMKELLMELYDGVLENHRDELTKHTYFDGREEIVTEGDY